MKISNLDFGIADLKYELLIVDWVFFGPDLSLFLSWGVNLVHTLIQQRRN
ncbi:hypothetical protein [Merismopedia glauca]